jgi:hypothetical protein
MSNLNPAEELELAAQIMEERGKGYGTLTGPKGEVCALGAILLARGMEVSEVHQGTQYPEGGSVDVLGNHLLGLTNHGMDVSGALWGIERWNLGVNLYSLVYQVSDDDDFDMPHEMRMAAKKWRAENDQ